MNSYLLLNKRREMKGASPPQANPRQAQKPRRAVRRKKIAVARASGADTGAAAGDAVVSRNAKNEAASGRRKNRPRDPRAKLLNLPKAKRPLRAAPRRRPSRSVTRSVWKLRL